MVEHFEAMSSGPKRKDLIGRPVGPYVVTGYVGGNPSGLYVTIGCPDCSHTIPPQNRGHIATKAKRCAKCGRLPESKVFPERLLDNATQGTHLPVGAFPQRGVYLPV